jgi:hypothetical protein
MVAKLARTYRLEESVRPTTLQAKGCRCLLLEDEDYAFVGMLTSKIIEYFRAGKPVIGIGMSETSTLGRLMRQSGLGFPLGKDINIINNLSPLNREAISRNSSKRRSY